MRSLPLSPAGVQAARQELANVAADGLGGIIDAALQGIERVRAAWHLPYSFLRHASLSVA